MNRVVILFRWGPVSVDIATLGVDIPVISTTCDRCGFLGEFRVTEETPLHAAQARAERLAHYHCCWQADRFQGDMPVIQKVE